MGNRDEEALRRFVACRDRADGAGAERAWSEVVELLHDRIVSMVGVQGAKTNMTAEEKTDVIQDVHVSVWRFAQKFRGTSMGELTMAMVKIVQRRCADHIKLRMRDRERYDSLDGSRWADEDGGAERLTQAETEAAWEQHDRGAERAEASEFLDWALPQIDNDRRRLVLERDLDGVPAEAIAVELRVTMPNLYQIRRRANNDLLALHKEYFS